MSQKRRSFLMTMGSLALADDETGRPWRQLTSGRANSYPLYYFIPSMTADNRYLIFHSERSGWVQLYRLDLEEKGTVPLTDGHTRESGWAIWCRRTCAASTIT